jgi:DNA-directed RNA polymerase subunit M/transcription elongation factor TFIIS
MASTRQTIFGPVTKIVRFDPAAILAEYGVSRGTIGEFMSLEHQGVNLITTHPDVFYEFVGIIHKLRDASGAEEGARSLLEHIKTTQESKYKLPDLYYEFKLFNREQRLYAADNHRLREEIKYEDGIVACPHCKSTKTGTVQTQARSADEGYTSKSICRDCKHRWTSSN